jgi:signal transduction histidine kinase
MTGTITRRFVMLVVTAAVAPLLVFGLLAISSLDSRTRASVVATNQNAADRAAEEINLYVSRNARMLQAVAADLQHTRLERWQQERILRNYVLAFPELREVTLFDGASLPIASSRLGESQLVPETRDAPLMGGVSVAPIDLDDDLLPRTRMTLPLKPAGSPASALVADLTLEELWHIVDRVRLGQQGFAWVVGRDGRLIAHGNPDEKPRIARGERVEGHPLLANASGQAAARGAVERVDASGRRLVSVAAPVPRLAWTIVVEQPVAEAFAPAWRLRRQLVTAVTLALFTTILLGALWGRAFIRPIFALMRGTEALAQGRLDTRVRIERTDEFKKLGDAFNAMADRLTELQQATIRHAQQAMFGRIAAGLVHDLSHPVQNISNNCKLMLKMHEDSEYRATFERTVMREFRSIQRVFEDLRNLARPIPLERFPVDVNRALLDVTERMTSGFETAGVSLELDLADDPVYIEGDLFALGRVLRNLVMNAIQATAPGGRITLASDASGGRARIEVRDTGCGIPADRLGAIFEDFVTTKRRGLGLGLAISKKIVEELGGTIQVTSEVGRGSTFVLEFPAIAAVAITPLSDEDLHDGKAASAIEVEGVGRTSGAR